MQKTIVNGVPEMGDCVARRFWDGRGEGPQDDQDGRNPTWWAEKTARRGSDIRWAVKNGASMILRMVEEDSAYEVSTTGGPWRTART